MYVMNVFDYLKATNAYPIPMTTLVDVCSNRGLYPTDDVDAELLQSANFKGARADILMWLSIAPNISQGGQSYSFSEYERKAMRGEAQSLYGEIGDEQNSSKVVAFGYKGSRL